MFWCFPGNHDFYSGNEQLWNDFMTMADAHSNIIVLNEYQPYEFDSSDGPAAFILLIAIVSIVTLIAWIG